MDKKQYNIFLLLKENGILKEYLPNEWVGYFNIDEHAHLLENDDLNYFIEMLHEDSGEEECTKIHEIYVRNLNIKDVKKDIDLHAHLNKTDKSV